MGAASSCILRANALRLHRAADAYVWREIAKLGFEWGGELRTGDSFVRQISVVVVLHLFERDPAPLLRAACERLPRVPDTTD